MQIVRTHTYDAPIERCWRMFSDPASHVAKFEGMGHHDVTVLEEEALDDGLRIVVTREVDVDGIPGFAKKFVKPRNTVVSIDEWRDNGDGTYGATLQIDTKGVPIAMDGVTTLEADGDRTRCTVTVDLSVSVPLVGGKLANFAKGIVDEQLDEEFALGDVWLAEH